MSTTPEHPQDPSWRGPSSTAGPSPDPTASSYPTASPYPTAYGPGAPLSPADQRLWAALAHGLALVVSFVAPLVVYLVFRGRGAYLEHHAKESLNFQITMAIVAAVLGVVTVVTFGLGLVITFPLAVAISVYFLVLVIIATVKGAQGEPFRYPLTLRLVG